MIVYNNIYSKQFGIFLEEYPIITASNEKVNFYSVVGRLGQLVEHTKVHENIKISCTFSIGGINYIPKVRELKKWLKGPGKLSITDVQDTFYEVLYIEYGNIERELKKFGRFSVIFYCIPYEFLYTGQAYFTPGETLYNLYDECSPIYKIVGEGVCVLTVNGNTFEVNVGQDVTIDTARMITYRTNEILNATAKGEYDGLKLKPGENTISITDGFTLTLAPRWGYEI